MGITYIACRSISSLTALLSSYTQDGSCYSTLVLEVLFDFQTAMPFRPKGLTDNTHPVSALDLNRTILFFFSRLAPGEESAESFRGSINSKVGSNSHKLIEETVRGKNGVTGPRIFDYLPSTEARRIGQQRCLDPTPALPLPSLDEHAVDPMDASCAKALTGQKTSQPQSRGRPRIRFSILRFLLGWAAGGARCAGVSRSGHSYSTDGRRHGPCLMVLQG